MAWLRLIIKSHACFLLQASSNTSGPVSTLNVANVGPQTTSVVQQKTSKAGPDIASMSCISGVKNEIAEEMKITENNLPLFGIETPHEVDLSKVSACEARGPGFISSSDQIVFLLVYKEVGGRKKMDPYAIKLHDLAYSCREKKFLAAPCSGELGRLMVVNKRLGT